MKHKIYYILFLFFVCFIEPNLSWAENDRYFSFYGAQVSYNDLKDLAIFKTDLKSSYFIACAIGKELWKKNNLFSIEGEVQFVKHIGGYRFECDCGACSNTGWDWGEGRNYENRAFAKQTHEEFNAALIIRWSYFPWDYLIDTSIAAGEGLSYATENPPAETDYHAINHDDEDEVSKILNYLMFEWTFALPRYPKQRLIFRIHHRSGIFGVFNNVKGGSNAIGIGLRYDF
ncbi:MAG: hypothetical protein HQK76_17980 [Desulfobacterales bacterium]|nr:hypothetical protein [Desulfobacterales bacterium]